MDLNIIKDGKQISVPVGDYNTETVKTIIKKTENPSPIIILSCIFVIIVLLYYMYITIVKHCYSGEWYNQNDVFVIKHHKWNDSVEISDNSNTKIKGYISGKAIFIYINNVLNMGIINNRQIHWVDGSIWKKRINVR